MTEPKTQKPIRLAYRASSVRWMIRRDMPSVQAIEEKSFEHPWTEDQFIRCLRQRDCIGMVRTDESEHVQGFMIYELHKTRLHLLSLAVDPMCRRMGVGTEMVNSMIAKLAYQRRNRIVLEVRESNLDAQLFFKKLGFRATGVLKDFYEDCREDAYLFQYRHTEAAATLSETKGDE